MFPTVSTSFLVQLQTVSIFFEVLLILLSLQDELNN